MKKGHLVTLGFSVTEILPDKLMKYIIDTDRKLWCVVNNQPPIPNSYVVLSLDSVAAKQLTVTTMFEAINLHLLTHLFFDRKVILIGGSETKQHKSKIDFAERQLTFELLEDLNKEFVRFVPYGNTRTLVRRVGQAILSL